MDELIEVLSTRENRLNDIKSELSKFEIEWIGHKVDPNGIRPLLDKLIKRNRSKKTYTTRLIRCYTD